MGLDSAVVRCRLSEGKLERLGVQIAAERFSHTLVVGFCEKTTPSPMKQERRERVCMCEQEVCKRRHAGVAQKKGKCWDLCCCGLVERNSFMCERNGGTLFTASSCWTVLSERLDALAL